MITPVANISASFQLSGWGDGLTLSLDIVIMVPGAGSVAVKEATDKSAIICCQRRKQSILTIIKNSYHKNHHRREVKLPKAYQEQKAKLYTQDLDT
jgi:hypothetical protein